MEVFISSDHGGFNLKNKLAAQLRAKNYNVTDLGPNVLNIEDDYPEYVIPVVQKVLSSAQNRGILICRNGVGVNMTANKFKGIRSTLSWTSHHAEKSRTDDDTNILSLPADYITETEALDIALTWLSTKFSDQDKYGKRLAKIKDLGSKI